MNYIVFDLEWNQSVDATEEDTKQLPFEVIEIGAVKLNVAREITGTFHRLIKPVVYQEMNHVTKKLIQMQMTDFDQGDSFVQVMEDFFKFIGKDYMFCTWGPLDLMELQRNMRYFQIPAFQNGPLAFYDVQKLFSIAYEDKKTRRSLEYGVDYLSIPKDIPFHRAYSDAYYTAKVFSEIHDPLVLAMHSYDLFELPKSKKQEVKMVFPGYAKYISREFEDKTSALEDREVLSMKCYLCRHNIKRKIRWFTPNGKHYLSVGYCEIHGYVKGKIRLKKSEQNMIYVVKTIKIIDETEVEKVKEKQNHLRELRREKRHSK
jgi:inhibitor of KinA sporulation pathway (predicted exonuclease)